MITFAWVVLFAWPIVAIVLYKKLSLPFALCVTLIGGYLLLPNKLGWDLPLLPPLDKSSIPSLIALVLTAQAARQRKVTIPVLPGWIPRNGVVVTLLLMLSFGAFGTVFTNGDWLFYGPRVIGGLRLYDAFSMLLAIGVIVTPLLLGRKILGSPEGQRALLLTLAISGLAYAVPALWEVRVSPQLHRQIYGFFQHSFVQQMRQGGFRPMVFLNHGLDVSIYFVFASIAAVSFFRNAKKEMRPKWAAAIGLLVVTLVLSKSLGALVIVILLGPVAFFFRPRTQLLVATCIAGVVLTYPMLRAEQLIPIDRFLDIASDISPDRAESLKIRIENEEALLSKARERQMFGWGPWSRNRIFDPETGRDLSITDGSWVIEMGLGGWFRYIPIFGLLGWPIIGLFISKRDRIDPVCASLAMILCAKLIDLLPNSGMVPVVWLLAGSLLGRLEMTLVDIKGEVTQTVQAAPSMRSAYTRDVVGADVEGPAAGTRYARSLPKAQTKKADPDKDVSGAKTRYANGQNRTRGRKSDR